MARIQRRARPDKLDPEALARMAAVVARQDADKARAAMWSRIARLVYWCTVFTVGIALFYSATR